MIYLLILSGLINISLATYLVVSTKKHNLNARELYAAGGVLYDRLNYRDSLIAKREPFKNLRPRYMRRKIAKFDRAA